MIPRDDSTERALRRAADDNGFRKLSQDEILSWAVYRFFSGNPHFNWYNTEALGVEAFRYLEDWMDHNGYTY